MVGFTNSGMHLYLEPLVVTKYDLQQPDSMRVMLSALDRQEFETHTDEDKVMYIYRLAA